MKTIVLQLFVLFLLSLPASAASVTQIVGSNVAANIPACSAYTLSEDAAVTFLSSTAFVPRSLAVSLQRNQWTISVNLTGGSNLERIYTGTLSPLAIVGTSVDINTGGIVGFTHVVMDAANRYVINAGDAASACGTPCFQFRTADDNANFGAAVNTAVAANTLALGIEGITQTSSAVIGSTAFGPTGAGSAAMQFNKGGGPMTFVSGTENAPGSANGPIIFDSVNGFIYASHTTGAVNQYARYTFPLTFFDYVTATADSTRGGFSLDTSNNRMLLTAGLGATVTAYSLALPGLTSVASSLIEAAGSGPTKNVAYDPIENKMFLVTQARTVVVKNPALTTVASYTDINALTIFPSVANGLIVNPQTKRLYYLREDAGSSLQLVALKYCS